jgi:hypothetical protein
MALGSCAELVHVRVAGVMGGSIGANESAALRYAARPMV